MRRLFLSFVLGFAAMTLHYGQNPGDSARYYFLEARKASDSGDFQRSIRLFNRIFEKGFPLTDYREALIRNVLGHAFYESGRYEAAIQQYNVAENLISITNPENDQLRISLYINMALYHKALGDFTNSLLYNNESLRWLNSIPEWDASSFYKYSRISLNRGTTLYHLGRYEEALADLKESERIKDEYQHSYQGSVYFNLARVYSELGDNGKSRKYFLKSIDRWTEEYSAEYYELANIYLHFGQFLSKQGQPEQGFEYLEMALDNYRQNYGSVHPLTAACYESMASHCLEYGDWEDALNYNQLALQSVSGAFESEDPGANPDLESSSHELTFLKILATKAEALQRASSQVTSASEKIDYLEDALAASQLSMELLYRIRNSFLSSESRIYLNSKQKDLFTTGIRLNLGLFRLTGKESFEEEAFMMAARGKAGELIFEMNNKERLYLESLSDPLAVSTMDLQREVDHLSNLIQIASLEIKPDSLYMAQMQDQLFQTRDSFNKRMEQLRGDFPTISQFESVSTDFTLKQIRRSLRRNETLIEYFLSGAENTGSRQLYCFVVTKKDCHIYQSELDGSFHQELLILTRNLHDFIPYEETPERFDSLKQVLFGMYRELMQPLEPHIRRRNLVIVPDDELAHIPFDALITELGPESISNYAGVDYLLHRYNISYVYNSQLIAHNQARFWRFPEVSAWIPAYATEEKNTYDRLKGAEEEIQEIFEIAKGHRIQSDLDKQELMDALEHESILHLAMHTLAEDRTGRSPYFILDSVRDPLLSNHMHDYEINALNISAPMVVLSSCETAGGQLQEGEGIMSLSRSFLQAGAPSVVHSLWPVEDVKSREIVVGFYREIKKGHLKSTALSRVKKQYIAEQPPFYTHPYYWAAMQITGNTSPLHAQRRASLGIGSILIVLIIFYGLRRRTFFRRI